MAAMGGILAWALFFTVAMPCLPLVIELLAHGSATPHSIFLTAAVMSAAYLVSTEHPLPAVIYIVAFLLSLLFDTVRGPYSATIDQWAGSLLLAVALLHSAERISWHIVLNRPFPERPPWKGTYA